MTSIKNIKAIFWNIGNPLTEKKLDIIEEGLKAEKPDIFCIAEGGPSKINCQDITEFFMRNGYNTYYTPLFVDREDLNLDYNFDCFGLKIFIHKTIKPKNNFSFAEQRENGSIVVVRLFMNFQVVTIIFLHNRSKNGSTVETPEQSINVRNLYEMIDVWKKKLPGKDDRIILMGDFNLEPWERILKHEDFLNTSYISNKDNILQRNSKKVKCFYNPIVTHLANSTEPNLAGTYYSDHSGWALFDYALYDTSEGKIDFDILTKFHGGSELLNPDLSLKKKFLNYEFDHLPIMINIIG